MMAAAGCQGSPSYREALSVAVVMCSSGTKECVGTEHVRKQGNLVSGGIDAEGGRCGADEGTVVKNTAPFAGIA